MGNCKHKTDAECAKKHQLLNKHEIEFIKEKFEKDKDKKSNARSKSRGQSRPPLEPKTSRSGIEYVVINEKKVPYCCTKYKGSGECHYEANTGKKCGFKHFNQAKYDELLAKLSAE